MIPIKGVIRDPVRHPVRSPQRPAAPMLVPYKRWQAACERVSGALLGGQRLVLVTGPAGTGKSQLLEQVAKVLRAAGWTTVLRQADTTPPGHSPRSVLIVDEADRLEPEALRRLLAGTKVPLVLAGLESLALRVPGVAPTSLPALSREEARDFIAQWLVMTGRSPANLETAGMRRLVELSGGVPRLIVTVLAAAAWLAESSGESVMTQLHIEESAALRSSLGPNETDPPARREPDEAARRRPLLSPGTFELDHLAPPRGTDGVAPFAAAEPEPAPRRRVLSAAVPLALTVLLLGAGAFAAGRYLPDELRRTASVAGQAIASWQTTLRGKLASIRSSGASEAANEQPAAPAPAPAPKPVAMAPPVPPPIPRPEPPAPATVFVKPPAPPIPAPEATPPPPVIVAAAAPVPVSAPAGHPTLSPQTVAVLLRRGHEMLALGDISAARLLFERAADAGSPQAMLEMGQTYDPNLIAQSKLMLLPNRAEAQRWYRKAASAGSTEAETLLERLGS